MDSCFIWKRKSRRFFWFQETFAYWPIWYAFYHLQQLRGFDSESQLIYALLEQAETIVSILNFYSVGFVVNAAKKQRWQITEAPNNRRIKQQRCQRAEVENKHATKVTRTIGHSAQHTRFNTSVKNKSFLPMQQWCRDSSQWLDSSEWLDSNHNF